MKRFLPFVLALCLLAPLCAASGGTEEYLQPGSAGKGVQALQKRLSELGFFNGVADGKYGAATKQAVMRFQAAMREKGVDLGVDGIAGPKTLAALNDDQMMQPFLDLKAGMSGQRVAALQTQLYDLNLLDDAPDGRFGPNTENALKQLQTILADGGAQNVAATGVLDAPTRAALKGDLASYGIKAPAYYGAETPLSAEYLYARSAFLVDVTDGHVLFDKDADSRRYPASTTKMMTLLLALEKGGLDKTVTLPPETKEVPSDSSLVPVYPKERMQLRDLLYGLMLRSGNDAANAVAVLTAGSLPAFVERMNRRAAELGMKDTRFVNPHGYHDAGHYTTAHDLALLALALISRDDAVPIVSASSYTLPATNLRAELTISNGADILLPLSPYHYHGAIGIKSGFTRAAGFCFVGAAERNGRTLIAVVLNCRTRAMAWADLAHLFDYGFAVKHNGK